MRKISVIVLIAMILTVFNFGLAFAETGTDEYIDVNEPVTDNLSESSETDIFWVELDDPGSLQVKLEYDIEGDYAVSINKVDSDGNLVNVRSDTFYTNGTSTTGRYTQTNDKQRVSSGEYCLKVSKRSYGDFSSEDYKMTVIFTSEPDNNYEKEPNDEAKDSTPISLNSKCIGNLSSGSDIDFFTIILDKPGSLTISLEYDTKAEYSITLFKEDSSNNLVSIRTDSYYTNGASTTGNYKQSNDKTRIEAGNYYIKLTKRSYGDYSNSDYGLTAEYTPESGANYEKEPNEEAQDATKISQGTPITGNLSNSSDIDYYYVTLGQVGNLQAQLEYDIKGEYSITIYKLDASNNLENVKSDSYYTNATSATGRYTQSNEKVKVDAGDYYFKVTKRSYGDYSNADYTLTILSDVVAPAVDEPDSWAISEVNAAIAKGLVPSDMQKNYKSNITRADFCKLAVTLITVKNGSAIDEFLDEQEVTRQFEAFSDTSDSTILAANALGIVKGVGNGKFNPNGTITREEAATMLSRTAEVLGFDKPSGTAISFSDKSSFSSWASKGVTFISACTDKTNGNAVMGGTGNNKFSPKGLYTRQQAFMTMIRLYNAMD